MSFLKLSWNKDCEDIQYDSQSSIVDGSGV